MYDKRNTVGTKAWPLQRDTSATLTYSKGPYTAAVEIVRPLEKNVLFVRYFRYDRIWRHAAASNVVALCLKYIHDRTHTYIPCSWILIKWEKRILKFSPVKISDHFFQARAVKWFRPSKPIEKHYLKKNFLIYTMNYFSYVFGPQNDPLPLLSWKQGYFSRRRTFSKEVANQSVLLLRR